MIQFLCKLVCGSGQSDDSAERLRELLREDGVGILSAACCAPTAAEHDAALGRNLAEALRGCGREESVPVLSITDAQRALPKVGEQLAPAEARLVQQIQGLVSSQGFSVFPMLVINRRIAFYGGLPSTEMIAAKLEPAEALVQ
jgi:hypothetical protein